MPSSNAGSRDKSGRKAAKRRSQPEASTGPKDPGVASELVCSNCGTIVQLQLSNCPICWGPLGPNDRDLPGIYARMRFDEEASDVETCPFCGEEAKIVKGKCTSCGEKVWAKGAKKDDEMVKPLVPGENLVFFHLDVLSGELDLLQRMPEGPVFEHIYITPEDGTLIHEESPRN